MRTQLIDLFEQITDGSLTPDDAYDKMIDMRQDLYSVLAKANNLVEFDSNRWRKKDQVDDPLYEKWWYLTKMGFTLHLQRKTKLFHSFFKIKL